MSNLAAVAALAVGWAFVCPPALHATPSSDPPHFQTCKTRTGRYASVLVRSNTPLYLIHSRRHTSLLAPGDEVAAFTPEGLCAGRIVWTGDATVLSVWEDDPLTPEKDGFVPGDALLLRAWDTSAGQEFFGVYTQFGSNSAVYERNRLYALRLAVFSTVPPQGRQPTGDEVAQGEIAENEQRTDTTSTVETESTGKVGDALFSASTPDVATPPETFALEQNFPNPFRAATTFRYGLPKAADVNLEVYDARGRNVATLARGQRAAGWYEVMWRPRHLAAGVYVARLRAGTFVAHRSLLLVR